jgi:pyrroline-5-carboxylate reductase
MHEPIDVGIIGAGTIGQMLVDAHYRFDASYMFRLSVSTRNPDVSATLHRRHPKLAIISVPELLARCRLVFLCVPPAAYLSVVESIAGHLTPEQTLVCVTNGVPLGEVENRVPAYVVKVIPSVAHRAGRGIALVCPGRRSTVAAVRQVKHFITPFAKPVRVADQDMRVSTNITGCGPALLSKFVEALATASAEASLVTRKAVFEEMAIETLLATAQLVAEGRKPGQIVAEAATGGGMTEAAVASLSTTLPAALAQMTRATMEREGQVKNYQQVPHRDSSIH